MGSRLPYGVAAGTLLGRCSSTWARARCRLPARQCTLVTTLGYARRAQPTHHLTHASTCLPRIPCPTLHSRRHSGRAVSRKSLRGPVRGTGRPSQPPWSPSVAFRVYWKQVGRPPHCPALRSPCLPDPHGMQTRPCPAMHPSTFAHWSLSAARDLTLEAARDASNVGRPSPKHLPSGQLKKLLDSRTEREVLEGLRRVVTVRTTPPSMRAGSDGRAPATTCSD